MALSKEDLQAIKELMNEQLKPINDRLDTMDNRLNIIEIKQDRTIKKLEDLRIDVAVAERDIRRDVFELKDEMETVIEVLRTILNFQQQYICTINLSSIPHSVQKSNIHH